jgi:hypothetical protein
VRKEDSNVFADCKALIKFISASIPWFLVDLNPKRMPHILLQFSAVQLNHNGGRAVRDCLGARSLAQRNSGTIEEQNLPKHRQKSSSTT